MAQQLQSLVAVGASDAHEKTRQIETTAFIDKNLEASIGLDSLTRQLLEELKHFLRPCADLAFEDGVAIDISQVDG